MAKRSSFHKLEIIEILKNNQRALSHNEVQSLMGSSCDRVTIYRILNNLVKDGVAHKVLDTNNITRFAACVSCINEPQHQHNHAHFQCKQCNNVTCLEASKLDFITPKGFVLLESYITLSGLCKDCSNV